MLCRYLLIGALAATTTLGCGEAFTSRDVSGVGGASSSATTSGAGGSGAGSSSAGPGAGGGGLTDGTCQAGGVNDVDELKLFTSLDSDDAIRMPFHPPDGMGVVAGTEIVPALNGNGVKLAGEGQQFYYQDAARYFNAPLGTVDFCFMPLTNAEQLRTRQFFTVRNMNYEWASLRYTEENVLEFRMGGPVGSDGRIMVGYVDEPAIDLGQWYRLTVAWSFNNSTVSIYLNGVEQAVYVEKQSMMMPLLGSNSQLIVGDVVNGDGKNLSPDAVLDELHIYGAVTTPIF